MDAHEVDRAAVLQLRRGAFASRLRYYREVAGLTQQELADRAGVNRSHYADVESGRHSPRVDWVYDVAAALEVHVSHLFRESA